MRCIIGECFALRSSRQCFGSAPRGTSAAVGPGATRGGSPSLRYSRDNPEARGIQILFADRFPDFVFTTAEHK